MKISHAWWIPGAGLLTAGLLAAAASSGGTAAGSLHDYTADFMLEDCTFSTSGSTPYFPLRPGHEAMYEGMEGTTFIQLTISVLNTTLVVDGVETRVIEERELHNGILREVSRNYFAVCDQNNGLFYFGEDVDLYDTHGTIVSHDGSWRAGVHGAQAGLQMAGLVLLGSRYYQEVAPPVAADRAEVVSTQEVVRTPAGTFRHCLQTVETTPLEPGEEESKWYAPGIGLIQDDTLQIVSYH